MIDNFELIKPLLEFETDDIYYFLQILQRKKEVSTIGRNSNNVKNYYIKSVEHLESKRQEIIDLCNFFNARAYIRLTPRSYKATTLHHLKQMAQMIADGNYKSIAKSYLSSSGSTNSGTLKRWIIDIDNPKDVDLDVLKQHIESMRPYGNKKVILQVPSKNGFHLITNPFDLESFKKMYPSIEVHKDNPTNLYIP